MFGILLSLKYSEVQIQNLGRHKWLQTTLYYLKKCDSHFVFPILEEGKFKIAGEKHLVELLNKAVPTKNKVDLMNLETSSKKCTTIEPEKSVNIVDEYLSTNDLPKTKNTINEYRKQLESKSFWCQDGDDDYIPQEEFSSSEDFDEFDEVLD